ncbi:type II toxin-antitoxin system RelE/ParE family toxin [Paraburkholderia sp.]|uniref:type II toxin-antitoxin system RelE/ParE family toxin n=1 Tax=Paraburkholderia sp. TaxID=1926495 RepID=UPI00257EFBC5|nr:type II toxin-antitoxin system RelE/ParE family toxin [Paraburkholderia sp.]
MPALIWHPDALDDVARLYDFLAPNSPVAARHAASVILEAADRVAENPAIGVPRVEFREWFAPFGRSAYVLRYAILDGGDVIVTRVWHSREHRSN